MEKKTNYDKLIDISNELPGFCDNFLFDGNSDHSSLTPLNYARDIKYFFNYAIENLPYLCKKKIKEITIEDMKKIMPGDINKYLTAMKQKYELSERTRARRKSSLSCLFKYLSDTERLLDFNPVSGAAKVRIEDKDVVTYLKREKQEKLLNTIKYGTGLTKRQLEYHEKEKERDLAIIFLFLDTGLRISELRNIDIKDVDFDDYYIVVVRKGGKLKKVYFSDEAAEYLKDYLAQRSATYGYLIDDPLFVSARGNRIAVRTIQAMLDKYLIAAFPHKDIEKRIDDEDLDARNRKKKKKKENISPHKLRASFAMEFYKQNRDILLLQERMGHKNIIATNIYAKASEDEEVAKSRNWRNDD